MFVSFYQYQMNKKRESTVVLSLPIENFLTSYEAGQ